MRLAFKYIVLGLGGLGSAAAYWLARRAGADVLGIEQFEFGHERGESQDHSRIIRLTYHTVPYVRLAQQAYAAWRVLEDEAQEKIVVRSGGLDLWPADTTLVERDYTDSMAACGVPFEVLDNVEIMRRFPQFRLPSDVHGIFQAEGGIAAAIKGNAAHRRLAQHYGATLLDRTPVTAIRAVGNEYELITAAGIIRGEKLVIAAGPWSGRMLQHLGAQLKLTVTKEQVTYYATPHPAEFAPERFPVWIWMIEANYYGFPIHGAPGVKVAKDRFEPVDPDARTFVADPDNETLVRRFMQRHLPRAVGPVLYTKTCLLTHTPDVDFVLDTLPGRPGCAVAIGAGHAYKFASVIGRTLSELLIDGATDQDIGAFRIDRPALRRPAG
jgi:sarcosine oxidase